MQPEITVLMPNYNNESFLKDAIDSILQQTFRNFIFLIIDDGSTDGSVKIIKSYADARIVLIEKNSNSGIVDALNIGLEAVHTKYFIRMDGDDISTPDRFETLFQFMEQHPEIGVCGSNMKIFGNKNELVPGSTDKDKCKARLIFNNGVSHPASIFRTEILKKNNITYSKKHPYMEDYHLFLVLKKYTEFINVDKTLYHYRLLLHNSTVKNNHTRLARYRDIFKDVLDELGIQPTERNVELHLEFFIKPTISHKIGDFKKWINFLSEQNNKTKLYPQKALNEIMNEKWQQLFFKVVPLPFASIFNYFILSKKITYNQVSYLFKYKVNKLIGRNQTIS